MSVRFHNSIYYGTLPGTILHELSHALIVWLLPNMKMIELDLTSHVEYEAYNMTATRTFLVGYAPLFINTFISLLSVYYITQISTFESITSFLASIGLIYIALATAFTAFPSVSDAIAPLKLLHSQLLTRRLHLVLILGPLFLILSIPGLIISYVSQKSIYIQFFLCCIYTTLVFLIGFEIIVITTEHLEMALLLLEEYAQMLYENYL